jgi:pyridoxamine 5'-phosphate oxidase
MLINATIAQIRKDYQQQSLNESEVDRNPIKQFEHWWNAALLSNIEEPNAMTLATCNAHGQPSARIVLLKTFTEKGFVFFTNYESKKSADLVENPKAALIFFWKELERQVRIEGTVCKIRDEYSDEYFATRPYQSKLGAWSSPQSQVIPGREMLEDNMKAYAEEFTDKKITRPPFWGGYIVEPEMIEFWQGKPSRLHDRIRYKNQNNQWRIERLAP